LSLRAAFEAHAGVLETRAEIEPVGGFLTKRSPDPDITSVSDYFALQHAVEIQVGHAIGGGLRYQGVWVPEVNAITTVTNTVFLADGGVTFTTTYDHYQGMLEPFFRIYHGPFFFRLGVLMPLDTPLGPPFYRSWGARVTAGWSIDGSTD
jgi:hypothetical protein